MEARAGRARRGRGLALVTLLCALPLSVQGNPGTEANTLDHEVRTALAGAVAFFEERAKEDEEGWVVPPKRTRKVIGHEIVIHRYREEVREIPVYEYEYETYEVVQKVRVGESAEAVETYRKVKKKRVVSRKQVGTREVKRLVRDPEGSIEREHRKPEYGPGGADVWARYAVGDNALALYALRKAGVSEDDATVSQLTSNLDGFLSHYGYPDETWDLAWLTAAFSTLSYEPHRETAKALATKLLDAQVRDGNAAGLWGPVAIHTGLLAEQIPRAEEATAKYLEAKKAATDGKRGQQAFEKADKAYQKALADLMRVATFGMAGHTIEASLSVTDEWFPSIRLAGLTDYIYNQRSADLESTALALHALGEASARGTFPEKLWRPEASKIEAEAPGALLARTVSVLGAELVEKSDWDEMNHHQPVKDFDKVGVFPGVPGAEEPFPKLASATGPLTTARGFSAMADAIRSAASDALRTQYRRHLEKGSELFRASAGHLLEGGESKDPVRLAPYDHFLFLSEVTREPGSSKEDRRDLWEPLARPLLAMRSPKGSWEHKGPGRRYHLPTSLMARLAVLEEPEKKSQIEYDKPHAYRGYYSISKAVKSGKKIRSVIEDVVPTSLAMVFLSENVRPPVIGECLWTPETEASRLAPLVTSVMRQQKGLALRYSAVARPLKAEHLAELPVLLIRGGGAFSPDADERKALQDYLNAGGLVLFEAVADRDGAEFLGGAVGILKELLPESATHEDVGADKELMGSEAGKANIRAYKQENGSLAAAFLPVAPKTGAKGLPPSIAGRAMYQMLFQKADPRMLEENYPISVEVSGGSGPGDVSGRSPTQ